MTNLYSRINISLPFELASDFKRFFPKRKRSKILAEALEERLFVLKRDAALKRLIGVWDRSGGIKFRTNKDLRLWRTMLWETFDRKLTNK